MHHHSTQVIGRDGRVRTLGPGEFLADGERIRVPVSFMDSAQRQPMNDADTAYQQMVNDNANAWRGPSASHAPVANPASAGFSAYDMDPGLSQWEKEKAAANARNLAAATQQQAEVNAIADSYRAQYAARAVNDHGYSDYCARMLRGGH